MLGAIRGLDAIRACSPGVGSDLGSAGESIDGSTTDGGSWQALLPSATRTHCAAIPPKKSIACDGDVSRWSDGPHPRQWVARGQNAGDWPSEVCAGDGSQTRSAQANERSYGLLSTRGCRNVYRAVYSGNQPTRDRPGKSGVCGSRWGGVVARVC